MKALQDYSTGTSTVEHIVEDSKALLLRSIGASVALTCRQVNEITHRLARHTLQMETASCFWFEEPLDLVPNLLVDESV